MLKPAILTGDSEALEERGTQIFENGPLALAKLDRLRDEARERREAARLFTGRIQQRQADVREAEAAVRTLEADRARGAKWGEREDKQLKKLRDKVERVKAKHAELLAKREEETAAPSPEQRRRDRMEADLNGDEVTGRVGGPDYAEWILAQGPRALFVDKRAKLPSGDLEKAAAKLEKRQDAIIDRMLVLSTAFVDADYAVLEMRSQVAELASKGQPKIEELLRYRTRGLDRVTSLGQIEFPAEHVFTRDLSQSIEGELGTSFACWLFEDAVTAKLEGMIRARVAQDPNAISLNDRIAEEAALRAEWLENQRVLVRTYEELERPLPRVHPLALFEVERATDRALSEPWPIDRNPNAAATIGTPIAQVMQAAGVKK